MAICAEPHIIRQACTVTPTTHTRRTCQQTSLNACTRNLYIRPLRRSFTSANGMGVFSSWSNGPPSLQCAST